MNGRKKLNAAAVTALILTISVMSAAYLTGCNSNEENKEKNDTVSVYSSEVSEDITHDNSDEPVDTTDEDSVSESSSPKEKSDEVVSKSDENSKKEDDEPDGKYELEMILDSEAVVSSSPSSREEKASVQSSGSSQENSKMAQASGEKSKPSQSSSQTSRQVQSSNENSKPSQNSKESSKRSQTSKESSKTSSKSESSQSNSKIEPSKITEEEISLGEFETPLIPIV